MFHRVVAILSDRIFPDGPPARIPTSVMEAALVGIARHIDQLEGSLDSDLREKFEKLRERNEFSEEAVAEGLSKVKKVADRFKAADEVFA